MFSRSALARANLRLSSALKTPVRSSSLNASYLANPARCAVPSCTNLRWFSATPAFRAENRGNIRTPPAPSGTCYIANVPYKVTAEELKDAFSEFGKVVSVRLLTSAESGAHRGVGFVEFESIADAVSFVETNDADPIFVLDRELHVVHAQAAKNMSKPVEPGDTLMVSNFLGESDVEVRAMFGSYADDIQAVRFNRKEADQSSRRAFIQFRNVNIAMEAMDTFKNQNENVQIAYARQRQPPASPYTLVSRLSKHQNR